jgi:hypothetical protein
MTHTVWNAAVSDAEKMHLIPPDSRIVYNSPFIRGDRHLKSDLRRIFLACIAEVPQAIITVCLQIIYRLNYCHKVLSISSSLPSLCLSEPSYESAKKCTQERALLLFMSIEAVPRGRPDDSFADIFFFIK